MPCFPVSWIWDGLTKEVWEPKNWCFWTVVLEKTLRVPWTAKRSNQSIRKKINPEYSLEGLMLKLKLQYFGHNDVKNWLIWKDPDAGKDWRQEKKGTTEDEMVGWHHQLDRHEFEQALGIGDRQGSLAYCSPRGCRASDTTEWLNNNELGIRILKSNMILASKNSQISSPLISFLKKIKINL